MVSVLPSPPTPQKHKDHMGAKWTFPFFGKTESVLSSLPNHSKMDKFDTKFSPIYLGALYQRRQIFSTYSEHCEL